jgi:hypothetical protein
MRVAVFLIALVAAGSVLVARSGTDQASSGGSAAGQLLLLYNSRGSVPKLSANAGRYSYVVLQPWDVAGARAVKRRNPHAVVLAYQEASAISRGPGVKGLHVSVGFANAEAHPGWFLYDGAGNHITEAGYPYLYMADIGNRGYQQHWADNALRVLRSGPWDGILMDDVNTTAKYHVQPSRIARYPDDAAYQRAMRSFLAYVRPRIAATHKLEISNMGAWVEYPNVVRDWLQFVDGGMDEVFAKFSNTPGQGYRNRDQWNIQLDEVRTAESMGKRFFGVTRAGGGDQRGRLFGWASLLLVARRHAGYMASTDYSALPRPLDAGDRRLGSPRGGAHGAGRVVYRSFLHALVVVNPDSGPHQVRFPVPMSGSGLRATRSATMPGHSALVLHRAHAPGLPPPQRPVSS